MARRNWPELKSPARLNKLCREYLEDYVAKERHYGTNTGEQWGDEEEAQLAADSTAEAVLGLQQSKVKLLKKLFGICKATDVVKNTKSALFGL